MKWYKIDGTRIKGVLKDTHTILVSGVLNPLNLISFNHVHDLKHCTYRVYIEPHRMEVFAHKYRRPIYTRTFNPKEEPTVSQIKFEVEKQIILHEL